MVNSKTRNVKYNLHMVTNTGTVWSPIWIHRDLPGYTWNETYTFVSGMVRITFEYLECDCLTILLIDIPQRQNDCEEAGK